MEDIVVLIILLELFLIWIKVDFLWALFLYYLDWVKWKLTRTTKCMLKNFSKKTKSYPLRFQSDAWTYPVLNIRFSKTVSKYSAVDGMSCEAERYATFTKFPIDSPIKSARLAKDGFFYSGHRDQVTCFCCKKKYGNWKIGDNPTAVHAQISPSCPFVKGQSSNIPLKGERNEEIHVESRKNTCETLNSDESKRYTDRGLSVTPGTDINIPAQMQEQSLQNEEYSTLGQRLSTFSSWPLSSIMNPKKLARAGFYYAGISDRVTCYSCGLILLNWEKDDDPYIEHARWFPHCKFLKDKKGTDFIQKYQETGVCLKAFNENKIRRAELASKEDRRRNESVNFDNATNMHPKKFDTVTRCVAGSTDMQKETNQAGDEVLCKLCNRVKRNVLFIPCRHVVVCETCAQVLPTCLECEKEITDTKKVYIS